MVKSQPILRYIWRIAPALALATLLSACSSTHNTVKNENHEVNNQNGFLLQASQDEFEEMVRNVDVKTRIMDQYASWKGVRYRLGGDTKRGIDCSAFVQRTGKEISRSRLRPGDLVLFRAGSTGRHVGIYLGNDNFVHASTSSGVMISSLNEDYWKKRYREARRVLSRNPS